MATFFLLLPHKVAEGHKKNLPSCQTEQSEYLVQVENSFASEACGLKGIDLTDGSGISLFIGFHFFMCRIFKVQQLRDM